MSFTATKFVEYEFECDNPQCNNWKTLHTGDVADGIFVHNIQTAFKVAKYHRVKGQTYCDKCFREMKCIR